MEFTDTILAIIVNDQDREKVVAGGTPLFIARDDDELQRVALQLSRILKAMCHLLDTGVYIIVKH
ncbi:hypothetical protein SY88_22130 [Clostridiales bacterium PH28_bin88]|nr:hypothetical protein SY88_22130 [Clostridiales bacterium PH28_bin88]